MTAEMWLQTMHESKWSYFHMSEILSNRTHLHIVQRPNSKHFHVLKEHWAWASHSLGPNTKVISGYLTTSGSLADWFPHAVEQLNCLALRELLPLQGSENLLFLTFCRRRSSVGRALASHPEGPQFQPRSRKDFSRGFQSKDAAECRYFTYWGKGGFCPKMIRRPLD